MLSNRFAVAVKRKSTINSHRYSRWLRVESIAHHHPARAPAPRAVEDRIDHGAHRRSSIHADRLGGRDDPANRFPLCVRQIAWITRWDPVHGKPLGLVRPNGSQKVQSAGGAFLNGLSEIRNAGGARWGWGFGSVWLGTPGRQSPKSTPSVRRRDESGSVMGRLPGEPPL